MYRTYSKPGKEIEDIPLRVGQIELLAKPEPGHVDGADALARDVGDLLGGHIQLQEGTEPSLVEGEVGICLFEAVIET